MPTIHQDISPSTPITQAVAELEQELERKAELIDAVTAALTGEFYVGQRVRMVGDDKLHYDVEILAIPAAHSARFTVTVLKSENHNLGRRLYPLRQQIVRPI